MIFVYGQRQRNGNGREAGGETPLSLFSLSRAIEKSRLRRPRHDAARVNSWKWVFKAPQRMLCRFLASTFVSITVTCYPLLPSPLPHSPLLSSALSRCDLTSSCCTNSKPLLTTFYYSSVFIILQFCYAATWPVLDNALTALQHAVAVPHNTSDIY